MKKVLLIVGALVGASALFSTAALSEPLDIELGGGLGVTADGGQAANLNLGNVVATVEFSESDSTGDRIQTTEVSVGYLFDINRQWSVAPTVGMVNVFHSDAWKVGDVQYIEQMDNDELTVGLLARYRMDNGFYFDSKVSGTLDDVNYTATTTANGAYDSSRQLDSGKYLSFSFVVGYEF